MANSTCLSGPAFSLTGDSSYTGQNVEFELSFDSGADQDTVLAYQWYLDSDLMAGQDSPDFSGGVSCGNHRIGARILTTDGWSGVKNLSFTTCVTIVSVAIVGPDTVAQGASAAYSVIETLSDSTTVDVTADYTLTCPDGSFEGGIFTPTENDNPDSPSTITATTEGSGPLTKDITITTRVVSITINGPDTVVVGSTGTYTVIETFTDDTTEDATSEYVLTCPDGTFSGGVFTPFSISTGSEDATITATRTGFAPATKSITIVNDETAQAGILVVDLFNDTSLNVIGLIDNAEVTNNHVAAYTGVNIIPPGASPADALILASDVLPDGELSWRFEFNLAQLITNYPDTENFIFYIKGRGSEAITGDAFQGAYGLKTFNSQMVLSGSAGSYIPGITGSNFNDPENFNSNIAAGANGSYNEADLTTIAAFRYQVSDASIHFSATGPP